jgi:hypothetical protein
MGGCREVRAVKVASQVRLAAQVALRCFQIAPILPQGSALADARQQHPLRQRIGEQARAWLGEDLLVELPAASLQPRLDRLGSGFKKTSMRSTLPRGRRTRQPPDCRYGYSAPRRCRPKSLRASGISLFWAFRKKMLAIRRSAWVDCRNLV